VRGATARRTHITKTDVLAAFQCARRAWLAVHEPARATPLANGRRALLENGRAIGRLAHALFPGAVLVEEAEFAAARARTAGLLADRSVPAILEAAVEHDGVAIRVDALERLADGAWGLREVKSGTRVRDVHLDDLAIQRHVLTGAGLTIASTELIHVDAEYVHGEGTIAWPRFFARTDVADAVAERLPAAAARIDELRAALARAEAPEIEPSPHCSTPYRCEFWEHCTRELPADWILNVRYVPAERWAALRAAGTTLLRDLASAEGVPAVLWQARQALDSGRVVVAGDLAAALGDLGPPADYLDFETISPALPRFAGTHPFQRIPFQWSLHRRDTVGTHVHHEFLADGGTDPRRQFAETLLAHLRGSDRPILVYSDFESEVLAELAPALPDLAAEIAHVRTRLRDLLPIVRTHVYHPEFRGSFSLKMVAPALVPGFGYDDLTAIHDGAEATVAFARLAAGEYDAEQATGLRAALRAYCARDTEALLRVHDALLALAATAVDPQQA
jgi:hypothetical protein